MARKRPIWEADKIRALRRHLRFTQQEMADEMGIRQQTVSEWETGQYQPRGPSATLLNIIAERAGFVYEVEAKPGEDSPLTPGEG
jgi:DNA-binding transcriptional regulator YiaG